MSRISFTQITASSKIRSNDVNTPLNTIYNEFNGNIDSNNLKTGAVTNAKLADGAVTEDKIGTGAVTNAKIGTGAVTGAKINVGLGYAGGVPGSPLTTTSTSFENISTYSFTITTTGGALLMNMTLPVSVNGSECYFGLQINGVDYSIASTSVTSFSGSISGSRTIAAGVVPAGTYTVRPRWRIASGANTATIKAYESLTFSVFEI